MSNPTLLGLTLTNEEYHKDTSRISKSGLDEVNKSPLHYHYKYLDPTRKEEREKDWAKTGSAVGMAIAEPDKFRETYASIDDSEICKEIGGSRPRTTTRYGDWMKAKTDELKGKTIVTLDEYNEWVAMNDAARRNKAVRFLLADKNGQAERSFHFEDEGTGALCRIRPDWLAIFNGWITDIKTTVDASPESFARSIAKFRYHVQDSFYSTGMAKNGFDAKGFAFIVVEKTPPYPTAVYFLPIEAKKQGRIEVRRNLDSYALSLSTGIWPGYVDEKLHEITLPPWAFK
jgi:hypothetical protein